MVTTTAIFVGDGSLLVQCAGAWRNAGHAIVAVVSGNDANLQWAEAEGLKAIRMQGDWAAGLDGLAFDYLFSVANLRMLPQAVLDRAGKLAVNFHDALLPRYAGLNATCWALMAREPVHGITWHEMTARADAGRIVRQASFEVSPQETALSLNAKCYEAGLAAFTQIARDLAQGELPLTQQAEGRTYFGRHQRPALLGTLDFTRPAGELEALVRALDFGQYANPLGRAKVLAGDRLLLVRGALAIDLPANAAPGTVLAVEGDVLRVAAADAQISLTGCTCVQGFPGTHGVRVGDVLGAPADAAARLTSQAEAIARGEQHWTDALHALAPVELPYPRRNGPAADAQPVRVAVDAAPQGAATAAALHAWLSALTGQENVSVLYTDAALGAQAEGLSPWLDAWVPLTMASTPAMTALQAAAAAESVLARTHAAGPVTRDLPLRMGDRHSALPAVGKVALALAPMERPAACELLLTVDAGGRQLELLADPQVFSAETVLAMAAHLAAWLKSFAQADATLASLQMLPAAESEELASLNATEVAFDEAGSVHQAIVAQLARTPAQAVLVCGAEQLTARELDEQSTALAQQLAARGVKAGDVVGLCLPRTPRLLVAVLGVMKAGAAYLPLDPEYPRDRLEFMVEDSRAPVVLVANATAATLSLPAEQVMNLDTDTNTAPAAAELPAADPRRAAYVIYTSGSTGKPKGVVVTHRNVMNFFAGMDQRVPREEGSRWLAVTSLSFDISVLELYWTLARGVTVVLHSDAAAVQAKAPEFSLFYFASDDSKDPRRHYELLMEGAKFADREGFTAVWTPERHFHAFGGLYPNPVVTSAAIAAATTRVQIRAGSCVLPLHHPVRVAEDWAFVDNISNGRVGISFASGWQPNDFILMPDAFARRQDEMISRMEIVRKLWKGEAVAFPGPNGNLVETRTLPRPVQKDIPVWITAAGNPKTFEQAGTLGCRLLTHLLGQKVEDVAEKIAIYRAAWKKAGHAGEGHVTIMLHTFVGQDEEATRETARGPMKKYLRSSVDLIKKAAWSFPTFVERGAASGKTPQEVMESAPLSDAEMDALLDHAFNRYYGTSALLGTPARCLELVEKVQAAGVDEIACLIDFGIEPATVIEHLQDLKALMEATRVPRASSRKASVADQVLNNGVTHLQCTPSMAAMLLADAPGRAALSQLKALMVGGEALPLEMATQLRALVPGALLNMYGPTETTVWSTTANLEKVDAMVPLGPPIANTQLAVRTPWGAECPALVPGELCIGGDGVTDGYLHRPELNAERFVADTSGKRWYRTGDLVRRLPGGTVEFLGRIDHQVKIRGHRIELGEIESVLLRQEGVKQAIVVARTDSAGQKFLAGYITARPGATLQAAQLREAVAAELPEIMVPQAILVLPALPMTPNGKVDRKVLPDPRVTATAAAAPAAMPGNEMETTIAGIWQEVLGLPSVGTSENFFDLGGHSLLVVQVQRRLREATGQEVAITDMFRLPTIQALAAHLGGGAASTAVSQGQSRAQARRMLRNRQLAQPTA